MLPDQIYSNQGFIFMEELTPEAMFSTIYLAITLLEIDLRR